MVGCPPWQNSQDDPSVGEIALRPILSILFVKASSLAFIIVIPSTSIAPPFLGIALSFAHRLCVIAISSKSSRASSGVLDIIVPPAAASTLTLTAGFTPL